MRLSYPIVGIAAILLAAGCDGPSDPNSMVGRPAPDFQVETLQSKEFKKTLASFKGKPVLLDFWATWCGPCRMISPHVEQIYEDFKGKGLEAMAISNEDRGDVQKFESETPHKMPVYIDEFQLAGSALKVEGLPTILVIDKEGNVVYETVGFPANQLDETGKAIRDAVQQAVDKT